MKIKLLFISIIALLIANTFCFAQNSNSLNFYGYDDGIEYDYIVIHINNMTVRAFHSGGENVEGSSSKTFFTGSIKDGNISGNCKMIFSFYDDETDGEITDEKDETFLINMNTDQSKIKIFKPKENTQSPTGLAKAEFSYEFTGIRNFRQDPNTNGKILSKVDFANSEAELLEIGNLEKIGQTTDFWYKVKIQNSEGWIFGGLTINEITEDSQATNWYYYSNKGDEKFQNQDYNGAINEYTKAIEYDDERDKGFFYNKRGDSKNNLRDYSGAMEDYSQAIEVNNTLDPGVEHSGNYDAYYNRGSIKNIRKDYSGAIADFTMAIKNYSDSWEAYFKRGQSKIMLNDKEGANADFTKAIENNPEFSEAYLNRGITWVQLGYMANACQDFNKAKSLGLEEADDLIRQYCNN